MSYAGKLSPEQYYEAVAHLKRMPQETIDRLYRVLVEGEQIARIAEREKVSRQRLYQGVHKIMLFVELDTLESAKWGVLLGAEVPCDQCGNTQKCKTEFLSCAVFNHFVKTEQVCDPSSAVPNEQLFNSLFPTHPVVKERIARSRAAKGVKHAA